MPNDDPVDQYQFVEKFPGMAKHFYDDVDTDTGVPPDTTGCGCSGGTAGPDDGVETEGFTARLKEAFGRDDETMCRKNTESGKIGEQQRAARKAEEKAKQEKDKLVALQKQCGTGTSDEMSV